MDDKEKKRRYAAQQSEDEMGIRRGMDDKEKKRRYAAQQSEDEMGIRRGPWTVEEDVTLINYIANHGEGRWNSLALCAGLKRSGKSCRLRWLNYLRPDVRRGNITLEEQLLILELHSRWGNRWSKIAAKLPGRSDNEIRNYWKTRVLKHANQLKRSVNSKQFKDAMRYLWMPRLVERLIAASEPWCPNKDYTVEVQQRSGGSLMSIGRTDNEKENHRHSNIEERLAGKEKTSEFKVSPDNNLECRWPLLTETSDEEDGDGKSESSSNEYSGPS